MIATGPSELLRPPMAVDAPLYGLPSRCRMRVFGRLEHGRSRVEIDLEAVRRADHEPLNLRSIGRNGAWAVVRTGLADLAWCEEPDGSFAIVDGELFNAAPSSGEMGSTSAAAILGSFRRDGASCLSTLSGTASVIVWDAAAGRLALARDRSGFGNCFWMEQAGAVTFGSEIISLIRSDSREELDEAAIDLFLASGFISAPWTSLAHIRRVPAAHLLIADGKSAKLSCYWRPSGRPKLRLRPAERMQRQEQALLRAVERQLPPSGMKSALLLSGGIDSMFLAALLVRHFAVRPAAFTYRYADYEGKFNETERARSAAASLGIEHHEIPVRPEDIFSNLQSMLIAHSGPLSYGAHSAILRDVAASGARVLYNGLEPDAPYFSAAEMLGQRLRAAPLPHEALARSIERICGTAPRWARALATVEWVAASGLVWRFRAPLTPDPIRQKLYRDGARLDRSRQAALRLFADVVSEFDGEDAVVRMAGPLMRLYSAEGSNRWSSSFGRAHGLLPRSPFQDEDYVDLCHRLPWNADKRELRELAAKVLPRELAFAPKIGQTLPITEWLRRQMADVIAGELSEPRIAASGLFRHETVNELLARHRTGAGSHAWALWNVLMIVLWQELVRREAGTYLSRRLDLRL